MYFNTSTFRTAILAGIAVGIAGWGYLAYNNIVGGVLFSFGLLTVVGYKLPLYTGTAGFIPLRDEQGRSSWLSANTGFSLPPQATSKRPIRKDSTEIVKWFFMW